VGVLRFGQLVVGGVGQTATVSRPVRWLRNVALALLAVLVLLVAGVAAWVIRNDRQDAALQAQLQPFYDLPDPLPAGDFGSVVRQERIDEDLVPAGSDGWRILYRSKDAAGEPTVSSGVVYRPAGDPPDGGFPIVVWAHGTVGMGVACAPSRTDPPLTGYTWLAGMLDAGFAVLATDYSGLGTEGTLQYLVGQAEANDVIGSVIAGRSMDELQLGARLALWGHSQGGHSVLWTGPAVADALPDVELVGVAAAAPAAELEPLIRQQWNGPIAWAIGPEVAISWPTIEPDLDVDGLLTGAGRRNTDRIAQQCVLGAALEGLARDALLDQHYFESDPTEDDDWNQVLVDQTVPLPPEGIPVLIAQGTADEVVLPNTTSLLVERYCDAGVDVATHWMPGVHHIPAANDAGPTVAAWLTDRFAGQVAATDCGRTPPVAPYDDQPR
jgi:alpha-beta hydrolase superfamily lysophospholipase